MVEKKRRTSSREERKFLLEKKKGKERRVRKRERVEGQRGADKTAKRTLFFEREESGARLANG